MAVASVPTFTAAFPVGPRDALPQGLERTRLEGRKVVAYPVRMQAGGLACRGSRVD